MECDLDRLPHHETNGYDITVVDEMTAEKKGAMWNTKPMF